MASQSTSVEHPVPYPATEEEYFALGDSKPYAEYVDGCIARKVMGDRDHLDLADEIAGAFRDYRRILGGRSGQEGRVRFEVGGRVQYRLPDVAYWHPGRDRGPRAAMNPPTVAVEIRSRSESLESQRRKCRFMQEHGVAECWLVDPVSRTVEVDDGGPTRAVEAAAVLTSANLPGFSLDLGPIFAVLDEED